MFSKLSKFFLFLFSISIFPTPSFSLCYFHFSLIDKWMALCSVAAEIQISTSFTENKIGQIAYLETRFVEPKCKRISSGDGTIEFPCTLSILLSSVSVCLAFFKAVTCRNSVQNNLRVSELYARQQDQSRWCSFLTLCKNDFWPN